MIFKLLKEKFSIISFIFFSSILSGLILIGVCHTFSLMLTERGVNISTITNLLLATIPYSWRFVISPFVKNIIIKYADFKFNILKVISFTSQLILFLGFSFLGFFEDGGTLQIAGSIIFLLVFFSCVQDIVRDHLKLTLFNSQDFGFISAVENTGFRLGMLVAGSFLIYIANSTSWAFAFCVVASCVIFTTISTMFVKRPSVYHNLKTFPFFVTDTLKTYLSTAIMFFKKHGLFTIVILILSFKMTDNCINTLKSMFLHDLGISRLDFAYIYFIGILAMIISGFIAGGAIYRINMEKCIRITFISQIVISLMFMYLAISKVNLPLIAIFVTTATFVFGFSGVVFRTFIAQESRKDVNLYTMLTSMGSLVRVILCSFAGAVVDNYSWLAIYSLCLISNIPGYFLYSKLKKQKHC